MGQAAEPFSRPSPSSARARRPAGGDRRTTATDGSGSAVLPALLRDLACRLAGLLLNGALALLGGSLGLELAVLRDAAGFLLHAADNLVLLALRFTLAARHTASFGRLHGYRRRMVF